MGMARPTRIRSSVELKVLTYQWSSSRRLLQHVILMVTGQNRIKGDDIARPCNTMKPARIGPSLSPDSGSGIYAVSGASPDLLDPRRNNSGCYLDQQQRSQSARTFAGVPSLITPLPASWHFLPGPSRSASLCWLWVRSSLSRSPANTTLSINDPTDTIDCFLGEKPSNVGIARIHARTPRVNGARYCRMLYCHP